MENSFQTSFIPKKPITTTTNSGNKIKQPTSLFSLISIFLLVIMGILSAGVYLYKGFLQTQKQTLSEQLLKSRDKFEKETIEDLELFDKRSKSSKQVLDGHIVLSPMLALLGSLTIPSIQYTKFDHKTTEQGFTVSMSGMAKDYKSIALQADVFNTAKGRFFKNVVFSNLTRDKTNNVLFDVKFDVDPSLLSYEKDILLDQGTDNTTPASTTPETLPTPVTNQNNNKPQ